MSRHIENAVELIAPQELHAQASFARTVRRATETANDILTGPTGLSLSRMFLGSTAVSAAILSGRTSFAASIQVASELSDLEGFPARYGDKYPNAAITKALRLKTSDFGRQIDPVADTIHSIMVSSAQTIKGTTPRLLGVGQVAQKALAGWYAVRGQKKGYDMRVTPAGKFGHMASRVASTGETIAAATGNKQLKRMATVLGVAGLAVGAWATINDYRQQFKAHEADPDFGPKRVRRRIIDNISKLFARCDNEEVELWGNDDGDALSLLYLHGKRDNETSVFRLEPNGSTDTIYGLSAVYDHEKNIHAVFGISNRRAQLSLSDSNPFDENSAYLLVDKPITSVKQLRPLEVATTNLLRGTTTRG